MENRSKNVLKTLLKFAVSGGALYIVFINIDWEQTKEVMRSANPFWLSGAVLFFTASKVLSSFRLNIYFNQMGLKLTERYNLRLYWVGMFYNLFLPGGIGGDGFKVYLLNKKYKADLKPLIQASVLDRVSGLVALLFLASILYFFVNTSQLPNWLIYVNGVALFLLIPVYSYVVLKFFSTFHEAFWKTNFHSLGVQLLQVVSAYFILRSLGMSDNTLEYQLLFLVSSVVAVFPFTIGGAGARELTFIMGHQYLGIDQNTAVAFSLIFFLVTLFVSVFGGFLKVDKN